MRFLLRIFDVRRCHAPSQTTLASLEKTWRSSRMYLGILYCQITRSFWNLHEARFSHLCLSCGSFHTKSDTIGNQKDSQITIIETCITTSSWHLHCPVYTKKMSWCKEGDGRSQKTIQNLFFWGKLNLCSNHPHSTTQRGLTLRAGGFTGTSESENSVGSPIGFSNIAENRPASASSSESGKISSAISCSWTKTPGKSSHMPPVSARRTFCGSRHLLGIKFFGTPKKSTKMCKIKILGRFLFLYTNLEACIFQKAQIPGGKTMPFSKSFKPWDTATSCSWDFLPKSKSRVLLWQCT